MISKRQALQIARLAAGLCVSAGLIYFIYRKDSPAIVTVLVMLTIFLFSVLNARSSRFANSPFLAAISQCGSRTPLRDLAKAAICLLTILAFSVGMAVGAKRGVIPDNNLVAGIWLVVCVVGTIATVIFLFRALILLVYGARRQ